MNLQFDTCAFIWAIGQTKSEDLIIVTPDAAFSRYDVQTLW
jgi:hypothetical protein